METREPKPKAKAKNLKYLNYSVPNTHFLGLSSLDFLHLTITAYRFWFQKPTGNWTDVIDRKVAVLNLSLSKYRNN